MGQEEEEGDKSGGRPGRWRMQEGLGQKERRRIDDKRDKIRREPMDNFPRDGLAMHWEEVHGICTRGGIRQLPALHKKPRKGNLEENDKGACTATKGFEDES